MASTPVLNVRPNKFQSEISSRAPPGTPQAGFFFVLRGTGRGSAPISAGAGVPVALLHEVEQPAGVGAERRAGQAGSVRSRVVLSVGYVVGEAK